MFKVTLRKGKKCFNSINYVLDKGFIYDIAYDLDFYEPNENHQKDLNYFDDTILENKIKLFLDMLTKK